MAIDFDTTLEQVRGGDEEALHRLIAYAEERLRFLTGVMLKKDFPDLHDPGRTDEQVSSVQNKVWLRMLEAFRDQAEVAWLDPNKTFTEAGFLAWLRAAIRSTLLDAIRKARRHGAAGGLDLGVLPDPGSTPPEQLAVMAEQIELFWQGVDNLSDEERVVFDMKVVRESPATLEEIAAVLGGRVNHVSMMWTGILIKLRAYLK